MSQLFRLLVAGEIMQKLWLNFWDTLYVLYIYILKTHIFSNVNTYQPHELLYN